MTPCFPIISIYSNSDVKILESEYPLKLMSLHEYLKQKVSRTVYYDKAGLRWTLSIHSEKYKSTFITKLLARTVYSPIILVKRTWTLDGPYSLIELIKKINHRIELDRDIITQYIGVDELKAKVTRCTTFENIIKVLNNDIFIPGPQLMRKVV